MLLLGILRSQIQELETVMIEKLTRDILTLLTSYK